MSAPRDPVDRVVDAIVAVPVACASALRQLIPIAPTRLERRVGRDLDLLYRYARRSLRHSASPLVGDTPGDAEAPAVAGTMPPGVGVEPADDRAERTGELAAALAIDGYDQLSARQVVDRLADLTPDELAAVERYEQGARRRQTILHRIAQLT